MADNFKSPVDLSFYALFTYILNNNLNCHAEKYIYHKISVLSIKNMKIFAMLFINTPRRPKMDSYLRILNFALYANY